MQFLGLMDEASEKNERINTMCFTDSAEPYEHVEPPLVIVRFRLLRRVPGILFQLRSGKSSHCLLPPEIKDSTVCHLFSGRLTVI